MSLSLTVHRGTNQIGGTCIEIAHPDGPRLILDAGRPLDAPQNAQGLVPSSLDLTRPATVLICHAHQDHWGILHEMPSDWPVWTGPISERLIRLGHMMNGRALAQPTQAWRYHQPFQIGPFTITAWLTDHSAPDAAMLLIEGAGQRIFYTGDFRTHGRKGKLVKNLMAHPPADIDLLITEGTNLGTDKPTVPETRIEQRLVRLLDKVPGRIFVYWSAQNIDRSVSLFRAARQRRCRMYVDLYTAEIMDLTAVKSSRLPRVTPDFPELCLMVTTAQSRVRNRNDDMRAAKDALIARCKASGQAISARALPARGIVAIRDSSLTDFQRAGITPGPDDAFVFSSWAGYADTIAARSFALMRETGARIEHIHTSGHASAADLTEFVRTLRPKRIVPVHGENWHLPHEGFADLLRLADGENYPLAGASSAPSAASSISR